MKILGIETSFDDTGIAVYDSKCGLIFNQVYNQNKLNSYYGGVVPELASREHVKNMTMLIKKIFIKKSIIKNINFIAYTAGPGLVGSLLVGATFAYSLGFSLNIPVIPVNHMEGHLLSPMLEGQLIKFPFIGLLVSGKHTQIVAAYKLGVYKLLGESIDDAAGEAFDKIAKLLGLKNPNGYELSQLASKGVSNQFSFPRPMIHHPNLNFSFSGLKTAVSKVISIGSKNMQEKANIARSFEDAVIDILLIKTKKALEKKGWTRLVVSGGVSANVILRKKLKIMIDKYFNGEIFYSDLKLCTDNGAMIAYVGSLRYQEAKYPPLKIEVKPKWSISDVNSL